MWKKVLFAIGGGEIGRTKILPDGSIKQYPVETMHIDSKIIEQTGKKNPKMLVVGTASHDDEGYFNVVKKHYEQRLNCQVSRLDITRNDYSEQQIQQILANIDIVYIGGGDTRYMLKKWQEIGLDKALINSYNNGVIMAGISAGAICWFDYYDNFDYVDEDNFKPALLPGLGIIKGVAVPHYDAISQDEQDTIKHLAENQNLKFYPINNCQAIKFEDKEEFYI